MSARYSHIDSVNPSEKWWDSEVEYNVERDASLYEEVKTNLSTCLDGPPTDRHVLVVTAERLVGDRNNWHWYYRLSGTRPDSYRTTTPPTAMHHTARILMSPPNPTTLGSIGIIDSEHLDWLQIRRDQTVVHCHRLNGGRRPPAGGTPRDSYRTEVYRALLRGARRGKVQCIVSTDQGFEWALLSHSQNSRQSQFQLWSPNLRPHSNTGPRIPVYQVDGSVAEIVQHGQPAVSHRVVTANPSPPESLTDPDVFNVSSNFHRPIYQSVFHGIAPHPHQAASQASPFLAVHNTIQETRFTHLLVLGNPGWYHPETAQMDPRQSAITKWLGMLATKLGDRAWMLASEADFSNDHGLRYPKDITHGAKHVISQHHKGMSWLREQIGIGGNVALFPPEGLTGTKASGGLMEILQDVL